MKIIQLHIYLFMWFPATESQTNIPVTLGADVIITCDLGIKEIYWYKQKSPDPPVLMLRTFDQTYEGAKYENNTSKLKYSVKTNSSLLITNITTDELGVYYCAKTTEPRKFNNGTKIYISNTVLKNQTSESLNASQQQQIPWRNLTIASASLNVFLVIAFIALGMSYIKARRLIKSLEDNQSKTTEQNSVNSQYAEVDISVLPTGNRPCEQQSIYSLLQPIQPV